MTSRVGLTGSGREVEKTVQGKTGFSDTLLRQRPDFPQCPSLPVLCKYWGSMPLKKKKKKMLGQRMENVMWALYCHPGF